MPLACVHEQVVQKQPQAVPVYRGLSLRGLRVLVVDDDPDALDLIATILRGAHAEAMQCSSPPEAPALLRSWKPHVLLSDRAEDRARSLSAAITCTWRSRP